MAEAPQSRKDVPGGVVINIPNSEMQLVLSNVPKEGSSIDLLLEEVKQLRIQMNDIQNYLKPKNDMTSGIFTLPDEILSLILEYLNQMDTIHLALTHRFFDEVCKEKLFRSIYVYDNSEDIVINIPKKLYLPFYIKQTIIDLDTFFRLLSSTHYKPELVKSILFANDNIVNHMTLDSIVKNATSCSIRFRDVVHDDTKSWLFNHQKTTASDYYLYTYSFKKTNPRDIPEGVRLITAEPFFGRVITERAMSNMKRLKSIKLANPPSFNVDEPIVVDELYLIANGATPVRDILKWFDLSKLSRLKILCNQEAFSDRICALASELKSLRAVELDLRTWDKWRKFTEMLKCESLQEIYFPPSLASLEQFKELEELPFKHSYHLKIISFSSMEEHTTYQGGWDAWKRLCGPADSIEEVSKKILESMHPGLFGSVETRFHALKELIVSRQVLVFDRGRRYPRFVPVEFYGGN
ncbi:uncharacterized protein J8A68_002974 [[Candida] subhashii]|uniref:F-box domain-containing protein n=1 Tax=[Candida] subhashii TaxID=561895 RepID=A0A8J5UX76_9ASCO|nr:uncharacterized protein J8A68_002974 [[Candida] subhashii]KAG7663515.1 hypothetical protein J8A68_002974 [[Candida] subhashii]